VNHRMNALWKMACLGTLAAAASACVPAPDGGETGVEPDDEAIAEAQSALVECDADVGDELAAEAAEEAEQMNDSVFDGAKVMTPEAPEDGVVPKPLEPAGACVAVIGSVAPNPATTFQTVGLSAYGTAGDPECGYYVEWSSNIDGPLSYVPSFSYHGFTAGTHTLTFLLIPYDPDPSQPGCEEPPDPCSDTTTLQVNPGVIPAGTYCGVSSADWMAQEASGAVSIFDETATSRVSIQGSLGNDLILANNVSNFILGSSGNDCIYGYGGNDDIRGNSGNDTILGGEGNDNLRGNGDGDSLFGEGNDDKIYGGSGDDWMYGGPGNDTMEGDTDKDTMYGEAGNDTMKGGTNDDKLWGGPGTDTLEGNTGTDQLRGEGEDDTLKGGTGPDLMWGGDGADTLDGDSGDDYMRGEAGNDALIGGWGQDTMYGDAGDDKLRGDDGADTMYGGIGLDFLLGGGAGDTLYGEDGNDRLCGNGGNDTLNGGANTDACRGGTGTDTFVSCETVATAAQCTISAWDSW
jgi:RTX calcium-binding nonapeptide repeat (4 copies)